MRFSPRFAVMIVAMILSLVFTIIDICAVIDRFSSSLPIGINPFWKLAFVCKLLTDSVILDDFKTALDKLSAHNISRAQVQRVQVRPTPKPSVEHREYSSTLHGSSSSTTRISGGSSKDADLLERGAGIAVMREIKVSHCSTREPGVAIPPKCLHI